MHELPSISRLLILVLKMLSEQACLGLGLMALNYYVVKVLLLFKKI